jgi:hypothetical protein
MISGSSVGDHAFSMAPPDVFVMPVHAASCPDMHRASVTRLPPRSNPLNRNHLASPVAIPGMKTMALKMAMVIISTVCTELGNAQSVLMLICTAFIVYYLITTVRVCVGGGGGTNRSWLV